MTERLYYTDAYLAEFDANVIGVDRVADRYAVILDRTAFYPASGGQPADTGRLAGAAVLDVIDRDDGAILHVVQDEITPGPVHGRIDWSRRFDHMQQHSGQHLLSAAFDRLLGIRTESFHLGSVSSTIDLARAATPREIEAAEDEANRIIWEDRPVTVRFADAADAAALPLRKEPARGGRLRLIDMQNFDISACGGTHVATTGGVGAIAVASSERFRGGSRIEFVCGVRALHTFRSLRDAVAASVRLISVLPGELPAAIERLQNETKEVRRDLKAAQARLATFEAAALAARATSRGETRVVVEALEGWDPSGLKTIATAIVERASHIAVLFSRPGPAAVVVARSPGMQFDSAAVLKALVGRFGGKGGGKADLAQGGGLSGAPDELVAFALSLV
ncbi:MAG: alanyl-tRNA synthetase [Acidobacteriota bacterium]